MFFAWIVGLVRVVTMALPFAGGVPVAGKIGADQSGDRDRHRTLLTTVLSPTVADADRSR